MMTFHSFTLNCSISPHKILFISSNHCACTPLNSNLCAYASLFLCQPIVEQKKRKLIDSILQQKFTIHLIKKAICLCILVYYVSICAMLVGCAIEWRFLWYISSNMNIFRRSAMPSFWFPMHNNRYLFHVGVTRSWEMTWWRGFIL